MTNQTKWADYVITAVRYNSRRTHIESVRASADLITSLGEVKTYSRETVISSIEQGITFATATPANGKYQYGARVEIVIIEGTKYIRTDGNATEKDNLGNLPEF
ncbi:MAG: DUF3892 domain-containing protein [Anaerolineae bacterium]|nr:DUF3892 domain-containing protein [Anaerolineae bacterium]